MRQWSRRYRTALVVGGAAVFVVAFAVLVWRGAPWLDASQLKALTPVQRETAIDAIRGRILTFGAGLLATGALVYTALNFRLSRESHVTDRYTKAIEQLGSERLDVRLGAIYALERIMVDSPRDHPTIVEVLAAFVREHSRPLHARRDEAEEAGEARAFVFPLSETDVQAAVAVLGRRPSGRPERGRIDLSRAYLVKADLTTVRFPGVVLSDTYLIGAKLSGADLTGADLAYSNLNGADLTGAILEGADLGTATLTDAYLTGVELAPRQQLE